MQSIWRTLRAEGVVAVLNFGALQSADGRDRRVWAADLRATIVELRGEVKLPG
jgi:1-acyl-sn-glycerol-3-phosphate acyltransferase